MFHFPAFPPPPYTRSDDGGPAQPGPGSPIRTPPDQSSLANSPGHIAGRNVLHQLLVPRHPPNAPQNHTQQKTRPHAPPQSRTEPAGHTPPHTPHAHAQDKTRRGTRADNKDARNHYTNHKQPTTTTTTPQRRKDPGGRAEPNTPPTKTGGGPPPRRGPQPPPKQGAAAPQRGGHGCWT